MGYMYKAKEGHGGVEGSCDLFAARAHDIFQYQE
jgi:hypothetical protein